MEEKIEWRDMSTHPKDGKCVLLHVYETPYASFPGPDEAYGDETYIERKNGREITVAATYYERYGKLTDVWKFSLRDGETKTVCGSLSVEEYEQTVYSIELIEWAHMPCGSPVDEPYTALDGQLRTHRKSLAELYDFRKKAAMMARLIDVSEDHFGRLHSGDKVDFVKITSEEEYENYRLFISSSKVDGEEILHCKPKCIGYSGAGWYKVETISGERIILKIESIEEVVKMIR